MRKRFALIVLPLVIAAATASLAAALGGMFTASNATVVRPCNDAAITAHGKALAAQGRQIFRYDTFGDQAFWGGALQLHKAIEGSKLGGVGDGVSPATALAVGLKVDVRKLPLAVRQGLKAGQVDLTSPATTWRCSS